VLLAVDEMKGGEIFVPKIPSMRITDLAKAIAPEAALKEIGVRPGEKIHEVLLTEEEARSAGEHDAHFVIGRPGSDPRDLGGRAIPEGFVYSSDTNTQWLSVERLAELARGMEEDGG
jgi:UDP-N-acetylglucosamine 4,6-dehydratase